MFQSGGKAPASERIRHHSPGGLLNERGRDVRFLLLFELHMSSPVPSGLCTAGDGHAHLMLLQSASLPCASRQMLVTPQFICI